MSNIDLQGHTMKLAQMALNVDEAQQGKYVWQILGRRHPDSGFADVIEVGVMAFNDADSALRSGYKAMLAITSGQRPPQRNAAFGAANLAAAGKASPVRSTIHP